MSSIVYGGVRYLQVRHAAYCKKCLETLESTHVHDYRVCSCGSVGIDGGVADGNRILGDPADFENRSVYCATIGNKKIWIPAPATAY